MELKEKWGKKATKAFKGKVVDRIEWLTDKEVEENGWMSAAPVIVFTDGTWLMASRDDEGNDAGALFSSEEVIPTLPVIR